MNLLAIISHTEICLKIYLNDVSVMKLNISHRFFPVLVFIFSGTLLFFEQEAISQPDEVLSTGMPFLSNFTPKQYNAHPQNFDIVQDEQGVMYFANFAGVLRYDGSEWGLITTNRISMVSCLAFDSNGRLYAGGMDEAGYIEKDPTGNPLYFPLPDSLVRGETIRNIGFINNQLTIITDSSLISCTDGHFNAVHFNDEIVNSFLLNNKLFICFFNNGLTELIDNKLAPVTGGRVFTGGIRIEALIQVGEKMFYVTRSSGIFVDAHDTIVNTGIDNREISGMVITSAVLLRDNTIALGTQSNGVVIINQKGAIVNRFARSSGIVNLYVRDLFIDNYGNLWAALNNGIAMISYPAPLSIYDNRSGLFGGVKDMIWFEGSFYVGTYQGLFRFSADERAFLPFSEIRSTCWQLEQGEGFLLVATSEGVYKYQNNKFYKLNDQFTYCILKDTKSAGKYYCGRTNGLFLSELRNNNSGICVKVNNTSGDVIKIVGDNNGLIWFETLGGKVFCYSPQNGSLTTFSESSGLPSVTGNGLNLLNDEVIVTARDGVYRYNCTEKHFEMAGIPEQHHPEKDNWYALVAQAPDGTIWLTHGDEKEICYYLPVNGVFRKEQQALLPVREMVIQDIYFDTVKTVYMGGPEGILVFNRAQIPTYGPLRSVLLSKVVCGRDSVLIYNLEGIGQRKSQDLFVLNHSLNSLTFEFSLPVYYPNQTVYYQHLLEGFEMEWSDWSTEVFKEYTNLPKGNYNFKVRARDVFNRITESTDFTFQVLPPWYNTFAAYLGYMAILGFLVYFAIRMRSAKLIREKKILEEKVDERTSEVVKQKEEIEEKSKALETKNEELEKINSVVKSINTELHFDKLLQSLLENIVTIRSIERATILLFDQKSEKFRYAASAGWDLSFFKDYKLKLQQAEKRYLLNATEEYDDIFINRNFSLLEGFEELDNLDKPASVMVLVIRIESRIDGFLILENMAQAGAFGPGEVSFLRNLKEHIISAFIKVKILEDLQSTLDNLKDTQSQLIQSEKLASLGQLTAGIAHEIQNPLNFVNNFSTLASEMADELLEIVEDVKDNITPGTYNDIIDLAETIQENVTKINEHGKRAESIVKGMLQHSRGKSGEFQKTDLNKLVQEYVNLAYHGMRAKDKSFNVSFKTSYDPQVGLVNCVPQDFSRAILNIVNNACYAVNEKSHKLTGSYKPEIDIETGRINDMVSIIIKDNGSGIPAEIISKIFNPFFTTKPSGKGTGLGLSMTHDIITQLHKGELEVHSEPGQFTEFVIKLKDK